MDPKHVEFVQALVRKFLLGGGNPDTPFGSCRHTVLHLAAVVGHLPSARTMLAAGADVDAVDADGETALVLAVRYGHVEMAELLDRAGASTSTSELIVRVPLERTPEIDDWLKRRLVAGFFGGPSRMKRIGRSAQERENLPVSELSHIDLEQLRRPAAKPEAPAKPRKSKAAPAPAKPRKSKVVPAPAKSRKSKMGQVSSKRLKPNPLNHRNSD